MTINSQPKLNGIPSTDKIFGWGPKNGLVYQKAFLEFFTSPEQFLVLKNLMETNKNYSSLQYIAINYNGEKTYTTQNLPSNTCALTFGVFPGLEIQQPTVSNTEAFW